MLSYYTDFCNCGVFEVFTAEADIEDGIIIQDVDELEPIDPPEVPFYSRWDALECARKMAEEGKKTIPQPM